MLPGELGNFALASHRSSGGGNFHDLHELRVGDHIYVETSDGWYRYTFRNLEYVRPSGVGVLNPVPQADGVAAAERVITLTTCNPFFSTAERIIAYGVYDEFFPRAGGVPSEIATNVTGAG
jgi:sortase A